LRHQYLPPALNLAARAPCSPESSLRLVFDPRATTEVALSNSFGFGGINACLVLRRWDGR
jgi:3-oxoacyl-(acyl-carrier-protein) synthase